MTRRIRHSGKAALRQLAALVPLIAAGLSALVLAAPADAQPNKVRLGYQYSLWGAPAVVALELDLFKKHGIEVDIQVLRSGGAATVISAIVGKALEAGEAQRPAEVVDLMERLRRSLEQKKAKSARAERRPHKRRAAG